MGILLVLGAIVYHSWLNFSPFAFADWGFGFSSVIADFIYPYSGGMYGFNIMLWKYPFMLIMGLFGQLGFDYNIVEKIVVFWPIIFITPLGSYLLVRHITKSRIGAFIGSLIFSYNTYFLSINTQGHELLPLAYAWAVIAILACIKILDTKKFYWVPISALILFIVGIIDLRSLYVTAIAIGLYFLFHQFFIEKSWKDDLGQNISRIFLVYFLLFLLNIYWIVTTISVRSFVQSDVFYGQLFGSQFYNIQNTLAYFYPFWTGKEPTWHYVQKIPFSFWLYPILAFSGLLLSKKNKQVIFFGLLALLGIFLSKQEAQPFSQVYSWLFENIPGFAAFREASKFNFLIIVSYAVLIGSSASFIVQKFEKLGKLKYVVLLFLALLPLWNTAPLLTGDIKTLFIPKTIPQDFKILNNYFIKEEEYKRVFAVNNNIYWSFSTNHHPVTDATNSIRYYWKDTNLYNFPSDMTEGKKIISFLSSEEGRRLLNSASVGYVVVNIEERQTNSSIARDLGENRLYFETSLGKIPYLAKQELGLKNTLLYKNTEVKPFIYVTNQKESLSRNIPYKKVDYESKSPTEVKINLKRLSSPVYLNTSNLYHPDWKIQIGNLNWFSVLLNPGYFLPDAYHFKNAVSESSYIIDPSFIKQNFDQSVYTKNQDGSINLSLTLYFRPQSYLYLGLIISATVLVGIILSILYLLKKESESGK